ncbi:T9SS type A sorting domain-containing protein [Flavobacterium fluviatile]|uniref:T9SS type A sorting domain-containing protein n=1 Tax=Flavobacterium fluviatile TaxID=1862387 RepID=UPI0013D187F5|nr:T9SS type A sorting domain-containing protein [Flavobacterium fluviatile]
MKKNYLSLLAFIAFSTLANAQITTIDFTDPSYDEANVQTDLNNHADWNSQSWYANGSNNRIGILKANYKVASLNTAIKNAAVGQIVSVKAQIQLGQNSEAFMEAESFVLMAFQATNAVTGSNNTNRDGVILKSSNAAGNEVSLGYQGAGGFSTNPAISQAAKDVYEVLMEITIGTDAASTVVKSRLKNLASNETSAVGSSIGINTTIYSALTGSTGAYLFFYTFNPFQGMAGTDYNINNIFVNKIEFGTTNNPSLGTAKYNAFEFTMFPNPVHETLFVSTEEPLEKVEIFNILGKLVLIQKNESNQMNVSSLSGGVYFAKLTSKNGVSTRKFIKN